MNALLSVLSPRDYAQITNVVALGLGNLSVFVPCNGERTWLGSLAHVIHGQSYWGSCLWANQKMDDVVHNQ